VLTDLDIAALVAFHRERGAEATLHLIAVDDPSAFGVVALDDDGRIGDSSRSRRPARRRAT
jgi:mannose-1-phosphate guanylyltransferase